MSDTDHSVHDQERQARHLTDRGQREEQHESCGERRRDEQADRAAVPDTSREDLGSSPDLATMKARLASPNIVALTPDAVARSAATPMTTKPTRPSDVLARLGEHVALAGVHRGQDSVITTTELTRM